jgi:4-amino-4-deoxy-L-arabinose transferase-like glycosyltransferase
MDRYGKVENLTKLLIAGTTLLLVLKLILAYRLDLYSDEIFYWLASTKLAPAYSDLPFMTALLVLLGSSLEPGSALAVRSLFLVLGSCVPFLVYWLALPLTGRRQALQSALLALCIPLGGFLGLLAVPDVPLLFFGILSIGFFERSLRTNRAGYWTATGVTVALGLCTHYRFLLYPAAAILFLLLFKPERKQWRNPCLWLAITIAGLGLIPVAWFNLSNQLASASFYLVERHPWTFQPSGLLHLIKQAGLVTPPLYVLLVITLWRMLQQARGGDRAAAMLVSFSLFNLLVYLLLAPWTDSSSTSIHWPLSGYFPLLVFAPSTLQELYCWAKERQEDSLSRRLTLAVPAIGYLGSIAALLIIGSQAFQQPLQSVIGTGVLSNKMAGWREFATFTSQLMSAEIDTPSPVIVTDNYYTAAQVKFAGLTALPYTVDRNKAVRDGRRLQMQLWEMDETALEKRAGETMLLITEDSTLTVPDKEVAVGSACRYVDTMAQLAELSLFNGDKAFSYYLGDRIVVGGEQSAFTADRCPFPARGWIDEPLEGARLSGLTRILGWAYNEDIGLDSVHLLIDGEPVTELNYGIARSDVVEVMAVQSDPNAPNLGYAGEFDTRSFGDGLYELAIRLSDSNGVQTVYGRRRVYIAN